MRAILFSLMLIATTAPALAQMPGQIPGTLPPAPSVTPPPPLAIPSPVGPASAGQSSVFQGSGSGYGVPRGVTYPTTGISPSVRSTIRAKPPKKRRKYRAS